MEKEDWEKLEEEKVGKKPWIEIGCCESCYYAREVKCVCRCGGAFHGKGSMTKLDQFLDEETLFDQALARGYEPEDPIRIEKNFQPSRV